MYLADRDIVARISDLNFSTPDQFDPFDPIGQVQPCSIDLRLGVKFWRLRTSKDIDLLSARHMSPISRRDWDETTLGPHESIKIKPGEMILGHTLEAFHLPQDLAGKLEGKSSYGRMGLSVHASTDFINPGWSGRMPLPLVNHSRATLRLYPGMPICQLMLIPLSSVPDRAYGAQELWSKYENDDGGPSYWWRDRHIKKLIDTMGRSNYSIEAQQRVLALLGDAEFDIGPILDRLEDFINTRRAIDIESVDAMLQAFVSAEDRRKRNQTIARWVTTTGFVVFLGALLSVLPADVAVGWSITFAILVAVFGLAAATLFLRQTHYFLTYEQFQHLKRKEQI